MITSRTRSTHLRAVTELFSGLQGLEMRSIVTTAAEKRMRRIRMDMEDQTNAICLPVLPDWRTS